MKMARASLKAAMPSSPPQPSDSPRMPAAATELIGFAAALLTSLCWLPQAWRTIRTRDTRAISLWTQVLFACGVVLWLAYGLLILSWPVIAANAMTLSLVLLIIAMKLRFG